MPEHLTTDFAVLRSAGEATEPAHLEFWVDWIPSIDGDVHRPIRARRENDHLLISVDDRSGDGQLRPTRRLLGLNAEALAGLSSDIVWVVAGPSGVLSRRSATVENG